MTGVPTIKAALAAFAALLLAGAAAAETIKDFEGHYRESVIASYAFFRTMISKFVRDGQERGEFRDDVDVEALATMVVATIDGLGVQHYFDSSIDPAKVTEILGTVLIESLKTEST